jgi:hypothetical protein
MESPLAEIVSGWQDLTFDELKLVNDPEDIPFLYLIKNLSSKHKNDFYQSFRVKPEYQKHFSGFQAPWLERHEYFLGLELDKAHKQATPDTINRVLVDEILSPEITSENVRCKLFYAMRYPKHIEFTRESGEVQLNSLREIYDFISQNYRFD